MSAPKKIPILPVFLNNAGCPGRCVYCNQSISGGLPIEPAAVAEYLANEEPKYPPGPLEIAFYGGSFTNLDRKLQVDLLTAAAVVGARRPGFSIRISTRPDSIDSPHAQVLKQLGVAVVELGVQSLNDQTLKLLNRNYTSLQVKQAVLALQQVGLTVIVHLMYGLPGEKLSHALQSAREVCALKPSAVRLHPTLVLPHTVLHRWLLSGLYQPLPLHRAVVHGARLLQIFVHNGIPVIRIGLQPNELLQQEQLGGPFHPAFRTLVESELRRWKLLQLVNQFSVTDTKLTVHCSPAAQHYWIGYRAANRLMLKKQYNIELIAAPATNGVSAVAEFLTPPGTGSSVAGRPLVIALGLY